MTSVLQHSPASRAPTEPGNHFTVGPAPEWAELRPIPVLGAETGDPVAMPLIERQVSLATGETFTRTVKQLNNSQGVLHGSRVEITFDPSSEAIVVHSVAVVRDGERSERCHPAAFRLIQREANLEKHVLDGHLTAMTFLEDVRVGDLIDVSYTMVETRTAFPGRFSTGQYVQFPVEVGMVGLTVRCQPGRELRSQCEDENLICHVDDLDGERVYRWEVTKPERVRVPAGVPSWSSVGSVLWVSDFSCWGEVAVMTGRSWNEAWAGSETDSQLELLIEQLRAGAHSAEDVADRAIRFVQNEIRYLSLEEGIGCFVPQPPAKVCARRFGDCKDKSVLLSYLLNRLGLPARPVLVSAGAQHTVREMLPSARAFDHVVVVFFVGSERHFVDPTIQDQGGDVRTRVLPQFGAGLVVDDSTTDLMDMPQLRSDAGEMFIHEEFSFHGEAKPVDLTVTTMAQGLDADFLRQQLETVNREHLEREIESRYRQIYRDITPGGGVEFHDDPVRNVLRIVHHFCIEKFAPTVGSNGKKVYHFPAHAVEGRLMGCNDYGREAPLSVAYPNKVTQRITAIFPHVTSIGRIDELPVEDSSFRFKVDTRGEGTLAEATFVYESLRDHVPAQGLPNYMEKLNEAFDLLGFNVPATSSLGLNAATLKKVMAVVLVVFVVGAVFPGGRDELEAVAPVVVRVDRGFSLDETAPVAVERPALPPGPAAAPTGDDRNGLSSRGRAGRGVSTVGDEANAVSIHAEFLQPGESAELPNFQQAKEISLGR